MRWQTTANVSCGAAAKHLISPYLIGYPGCFALAQHDTLDVGACSRTRANGEIACIRITGACRAIAKVSMQVNAVLDGAVEDERLLPLPLLHGKGKVALLIHRSTE